MDFIPSSIVLAAVDVSYLTEDKIAEILEAFKVEHSGGNARVSLKIFKYFNIITVDDYDVPIFHKHKASHPYHQHGRTNTLRQAVRGD